MGIVLFALALGAPLGFACARFASALPAVMLAISLAGGFLAVSTAPVGADQAAYTQFIGSIGIAAVFGFVAGKVTESG